MDLDSNEIEGEITLPYFPNQMIGTIKWRNVRDFLLSARTNTQQSELMSHIRSSTHFSIINWNWVYYFVVEGALLFVSNVVNASLSQPVIRCADFLLRRYTILYSRIRLIFSYRFRTLEERVREGKGKEERLVVEPFN